jgi:hypothetical protein
VNRRGYFLLVKLGCNVFGSSIAAEKNSWKDWVAC